MEANLEHGSHKKHRDGVLGAAANSNDLGDIFDIIDTDGDGAISADDLAKVHKLNCENMVLAFVIG